MLCFTKKLLRNGKECLFRSPVGLDDAASLLALTKTVCSETDTVLPPEQPLYEDISSESAYLDLIADSSDCLILAAEVDGAFAGSACLLRSADPARKDGVVGLAVLREFWHAGIGSGLLGILIARADRAGYETLQLDVRRDNARAVSLYEKYGFTVTDASGSGLVCHMVLPMKKAGQNLSRPVPID